MGQGCSSSCQRAYPCYREGCPFNTVQVGVDNEAAAGLSVNAKDNTVRGNHGKAQFGTGNAARQGEGIIDVTNNDVRPNGGEVRMGAGNKGGTGITRITVSGNKVLP